MRPGGGGAWRETGRGEGKQRRVWEKELREVWGFIIKGGDRKKGSRRMEKSLFMACRLGG